MVGGLGGEAQILGSNPTGGKGLFFVFEFKHFCDFLMKNLFEMLFSRNPNNQSQGFLVLKIHTRYGLNFGA